MAEYIDREKLIRDLIDNKEFYPALVKSAIENAPTADVVPRSELNDLEYKLIGVMHSVDKWLEDWELEQDEVNRAATMREKTLSIIERLTEENQEVHSNWQKLKKEYDELGARTETEFEKAKQEVAREIFGELETSLCYKLINGEIHLIIRETDYKHYKKKCIGDK